LINWHLTPTIEVFQLYHCVFTRLLSFDDTLCEYLLQL